MAGAAVFEQAYRYERASTVTEAGGRVAVDLATSGGVEDHPRFFRGMIGSARQNAALLLEVARVARTRFYTPPAMVAAIIRAADPVVTSNGDRLRFESFSACCGVYARLDLRDRALADADVGRGTTNVDFNPPMRQALARVGDSDPMHLAVGVDDVEVTTLRDAETERKVPLPDRWLKGFAEVQLAQSAMTLRGEISGVEAQRFLRSLPRTPTRTPLWVTPAGVGLRMSTQARKDGVRVAGPERLQPFAALARYATALRYYGPPEGAAGASGWELVCPDASVFLVLSPETSRGFSGEGNVLFHLAAGADEVVDSMRPQLEFQSVVEAPVDVLEALGAAGIVGYDLSREAFFHRELPFEQSAIGRLHPRLRDAQALFDEGRVTVLDREALVVSGDATHRVRWDEGGAARCTCTWFAKHRGERGPCKHVLAVELARA